MPEPCQGFPEFGSFCGTGERDFVGVGGGVGLSKKFSLTAKRSDSYLGLSHAGVAQLVEHHLAKVDVESSSLFARSISIKRPVATPGAFSCPNATDSRGLGEPAF